MLILCRFHTIGILLFLLHTTYSFVLLTANVEDVKRLASKFVPESLAEKIAQFLAKASGQLVTNVMDERMVDEVSEENNKYNIARQNKVADTQKTRDRYVASFERIEPAGVDESNDNTIESTERAKIAVSSKYIENYAPINNGKFMNSKEYNSRYVPPYRHTNYEQSRYSEAKAFDSMRDTQAKILKGLKREDHKKMPERYNYGSESKEQYNSKYLQSKHKTTKPSYETNYESTIGFSEKYEPRDNTVKRKLKSRINHVRAHNVNTEKQLEVIEINEPNTHFTDEGIQRAEDLTTKTFRSEFDQYVNINYPKSEFIATSGPVALTKVPADKKWTDDNDDVTTV